MMWNKVVSWLLSLYSLFYPGPGPCPSLQLMPANTLDQQQFLGKWYFRAAASCHQAHIAKFKPLDSLWFSMEKSGNDTLLLTGHMHMEGPPQEPAVERPVGQLPRVHHPTGGGARGGPEQTAAVRPPQGHGPRRGGRLSEERSLSQHVGQRYTSLGKRIVRLKIKNELGAALPPSVCNSWITAGFRVRSVSRVLLQPGPQRKIKTVSMCRVRSWTVLNEPSAVLEAF